MRRTPRAKIVDLSDPAGLSAFEVAADLLAKAKKAVAFSGAGISVESGIPDFRSPGGLWTRYPPEEYATIDAFLDNPEKVWGLFREMGKTIAPARPNPAHLALARLEEAGRLASVITQNIDGLHRKGGSRNVIELHGEHESLHCIACGETAPFPEDLLDADATPRCPRCDHPLKPNVVLFGEGVRGLEETAKQLTGCDLLLVLGTSAQVYPAAGIPAAVKGEGGTIFEFNLETTPLTHGEAFGLLWGAHATGLADYFFQGPVGETLPVLVDRVLGGQERD
ncbi:MAG: SIR2 family NAD-dependent protein deacylase [Planctomycetota bacterium]|jgi:NAD-dependent deacetylase